MAFRINGDHQLGMDDSTYNLTERELRFLRRSWAESFANHIYPNLDEEPFSVLYSGNDASKPNAPVNIILGLLMLKDSFGLTDEELMEQMLFNVQFQYALHTTSFAEQPINDNTLRRFRNRVYAYEELTGIDLIKGAFVSLRDKISGIMGIDPSLKRMDSEMISAGARRLSRLGIMYETLKMASRQLGDAGLASPISEKYSGDNARSDIGYKIKSEEVKAKMEEMLRDAVAMLEDYPGQLRATEAFTALSRMIGDQSRMTEDGRVLKAGKEISPESMQTPYEQDATYRKKSKKDHVGYVANFVEACDGDKNLITDYDLQKNTYSDAQFGMDALGAMSDGETENVVVDGAYVSPELLDKAEAMGIGISAGAMLGGLQGAFEAEFKMDGDGNIEECPAGASPIDARRGKDCSMAHFETETCANCPYCDRCPKVFQKKAVSVKVTDAAVQRAEFAQKMGGDEYRELINKRNGVEGIMSVFRRKYDVDRMRAKGLVRKRHRLGLKVMAENARRLFRWGENQVHTKLCFQFLLSTRYFAPFSRKLALQFYS